MDNQRLDVETVVVGDLEANCYILSRGPDGIVIDPGAEPEKLLSLIGSKHLKIAGVFLTHGHADHIIALKHLEFDIYIHQKDRDFLFDPRKNFSIISGRAFSLDKDKPVIPVEEGELSIGAFNFRLIHTPGHTPGSSCLLIGRFLFTGDTLFANGIGRTDLPGGSSEDLNLSIKEKLFTLSDDVICFPGHGPKTSIGSERRENPFF